MTKTTSPRADCKNKETPTAQGKSNVPKSILGGKERKELKAGQ